MGHGVLRYVTRLCVIASTHTYFGPMDGNRVIESMIVNEKIVLLSFKIEVEMQNLYKVKILILPHFNIHICSLNEVQIHLK